MSARRGRPPAIDASRVWEAAEVFEQIIDSRHELVHTVRMGWLLRRWDSDLDYLGKPCMRWSDLDSAPDGQLGALLLRHQQRQRPGRAVQPKTDKAAVT